jgi:hypothetical protein
VLLIELKFLLSLQKICRAPDFLENSADFAGRISAKGGCRRATKFADAFFKFQSQYRPGYSARRPGPVTLEQRIKRRRNAAALPFPVALRHFRASVDSHGLFRIFARPIAVHWREQALTWPVPARDVD